MIRDATFKINDLLEALELTLQLRIKSVRWKTGKDQMLITFDDDEDFIGEYYFNQDGMFVDNNCGIEYPDLSVAKLYHNAHPEKTVLGVVLYSANDAFYLKVREDVQKNCTY